MKERTSILTVLVSFLVLICQPLSAKCVPLIKEARERLADAHLSKGDESKAKALLEEADNLSQANNHKEGIQKANEALSIIKKKK